MKISTGTLVFNASSILPEGMLEAQLKHLYSFSDEILITEGATKATTHRFDGDTSWLTKDGHSTDDTIEIIKHFPDPENKIRLIQKNGFWNGKTEMCNEWSKRATGDYLWQVDSDEFYLEEDIIKIKHMLKRELPDAVHFYANHFWGDYKNCIDENTGKGWGNNIPWMRIFKHDKGSKWISHEPPNYQLSNGLICNQGKVITRDQTLSMGIKMQHYSYVCEEQINFKSKFFRNDIYQKLWKEWKNNKNIPLLNGSKTVEYKGKYPKFINRLLSGQCFRQEPKT